MSKKEFKVTLMICSLMIVVLVAIGLIFLAVALHLAQTDIQMNRAFTALDRKPLFIIAVLCFFNTLAPAGYIVDLTKNVEKVTVKEEE